MFAEDIGQHGDDPLAIEKACIDMRTACISGVEEQLPNAAVVHDRFHVLKLVNDAMDLVRRAKQKIWKVLLKKTRYLLLGNREDPSDANSERVENLTRMKLETDRDCEKKEELRRIFSSGLTRQEGEPELRKWNAWAQRSRLEPFVKLNRTIGMHMHGIPAIFDNPGLSNRQSEGIAR